jgi:glycosyltransferase involved in cell wall biosynthesis
VDLQQTPMNRPRKVVLFANTDWYLYNFRLSLAERLRDTGHELLLLSPPGKYGDKLLELGFRWQALPMVRRSLNPLREAALLGHLVTLLRTERPDLIHSFTIKCAIYGSLAARAAGVRARVNAVTGMGYVFTSDDARARLLRPVVRTLIGVAFAGRGARLILQNGEDLAMLEEAGLLNGAQTRLIPGSGVDCVRFHGEPPKRKPGEPLTLVLASRLLWDKGIAEYAEAARLLKAEGRNIRFLLAGDPDPGNPAAIPADVVQGWEREGLIERLGHVDDMPGLFRGADVVVLPSYREGLPKSLIEAAACARPLITTDAPGCREVVSDGVEGFVVPVRQAEPLARAIARLDDDPLLGARFGAAARAKALACFDQEIVLDRTLAVYRELLG